MKPHEYGVRAFQQGKPRVPAQDQAFLREHCNGPIGSSGCKKALNEWLRGWDEANLRASVE